MPHSSSFEGDRKDTSSDKVIAQQTTDAVGNDLDLYLPDVDTSSVDERKLLRKVDLYVIPWLALLYLLNFLDRGTIGNAKVSLQRVNPEVIDL